MNIIETTYQHISGSDELPIYVLRIEPEDPKNIKGIVQMVHGKNEYTGRYTGLMRYLAEQGYLTIVNDHRGHGESVLDASDRGYWYEGGFQALVEDLHEITQEVKQYAAEKCGRKDLPFTMLGHSMGSLAARCYIRKYDTLPLPFADTIGFLMQESHPLAQKQALRMEDVVGVPLIVPSQGQSVSSSASLMNQDFDPGRLNIVCHYNLLFNAAVMVEQGMGIALCLDHLADTTEHTGLTFRPLYPAALNRLRLAWKKYQIFSPAAELFLRRIRQQFEAPDRR